MTIVGPATIEAADWRLTLARDVATDDFTEAIIRRAPSAPVDRPAFTHLRIALLERNVNLQQWQSRFVKSQDETVVVSIGIIGQRSPLWEVSDEDLAAALKIASPRPDRTLV